MPADYLHLRFTSPAALARMLEFYQGRGRALLQVTAPGLASPYMVVQLQVSTLVIGMFVVLVSHVMGIACELYEADRLTV